MNWLKNNMDKILLLTPAAILLLASQLAIAGYEAETITTTEKTVAEFQTESNEEETKQAIVMAETETSALSEELENQELENQALETTENMRNEEETTEQETETTLQTETQKVTESEEINQTDKSEIAVSANEQKDNSVATTAASTTATTATTAPTTAATAATAPENEPTTAAANEPTTQHQETGRYKNGTYKAEVICYPDGNYEFDEYTLRLYLTIASDKIVSITDITGSGEEYVSDNDKFISRASQGTSKYTGMVTQILAVGDMYDSNGMELSFDTVSGATCSSKAILNACRNALNQAKISQ